jgi:serine protease SohB
MERCMVDDLRTSDECIIDACKEADVYEVEYEFRKSLQDKLGSVFEESTAKLFGRWFNRSTNDIYQ